MYNGSLCPIYGQFTVRNLNEFPLFKPSQFDICTFETISWKIVFKLLFPTDYMLCI